LQIKKETVLILPHGFAAPRALRMAQYEFASKEAEDARGGVVVCKNNRYAGTDQVGEPEGRRNVLFTRQHGKEPIVLFEPEPGFDRFGRPFLA